jgi:integrase
MPSEKTPSAQRPKLARVTDLSFAALVRAFKEAKFKGYSQATKDLWGRELDFAARPDCLGALSRHEIRPSLVQAFFDGISDRPGKQAASLAVLKELERWAVVRDLLPRQITLGVEIEDSDGGHIPWTAEQVAYAETNLPPHLSRAITLGANTGQRGSDLIRMGWADLALFQGIEGINVRQKKTGRELWVPIISTLASAMRTWERRPGPFLTRADGRLWTRKQLTGAWTYIRETNDVFASYRLCGPDRDRPMVLHGLRGHACVRLLHAGANTRQISDMVGMSEEIVKTYTKFSVQRENAVAAVYHMERTIREQNPDKTEKGAS